MATIARMIESAHPRDGVSAADVVAVVVAILSLLTCTIVLPSAIHLPW